MPRRKQPRADATTGPISLTAPRVLLAGFDTPARDTLLRRFTQFGALVTHAWSAAEALGLVRAGEFNLLVAAERLTDARGCDLAETATRLDLALVCVLASPSPTLDAAVDAMRSGVSDFWPASLPADALRERFDAAMRKARELQARRERFDRLRRLCKQLNGARQEVSRQVGSLCTDLADAYKELTDQFGKVTLASEFSGVVRQELEVESLLRTTLEFVLAKLGSTNAAIFLPASSGEYSLGAYVNYDVPRDTAEVLLDHLAAVLAPRFEKQTEVTILESAEALEDKLGDHAHWMGESALAALACRHDDETLAVIVLFRDRRSGFNETHREGLRVIGDIFGRQLARVIHVHHRHLPKDQWGTPEPDEPEDGLEP
ncbi:MAG: GAF domain-containing protein [Phycisphaerae bacterium]|nr:GAF domain-containing protein [Phycisphaerae bacterium]